MLSAQDGGDPVQSPAGPNATATVTVVARSLTSVLSCDLSATIGLPTSCMVTVTDGSPGTFITPTGEVMLTTSGSGPFRGRCILTVRPACERCSLTYTLGETA